MLVRLVTNTTTNSSTTTNSNISLFCVVNKSWFVVKIEHLVITHASEEIFTGIFYCQINKIKEKLCMDSDNSSNTKTDTKTNQTVEYCITDLLFKRKRLF